MPQMAPYNWIHMFMIFNFIMILIITYMHFTLLKTPQSTFTPLPQNFNFKW